MTRATHTGRRAMSPILAVDSSSQETAAPTGRRTGVVRRQLIRSKTSSWDGTHAGHAGHMQAPSRRGPRPPPTLACAASRRLVPSHARNTPRAPPGGAARACSSPVSDLERSVAWEVVLGRGGASSASTLQVGRRANWMQLSQGHNAWGLSKLVISTETNNCL